MSRNPYSWKHFLKDYFIFSKGERNALLVLMVCMLLAAAFPLMYDAVTHSRQEQLPAVTITEIKEWQEEAPIAQNDSKADTDAVVYNRHLPAAVNNSETFYFDPNTASFADWKRLGIRDKTIETIVRYRSKGGHFYKAADLSKIYGLRPIELDRLLPYVKISTATTGDAVKYEHGKPVAAIKARPPATIDINTADTTQWIALPGIGSKLAARIVKYRDLLGGFYTLAQVGEVYGLPDSTFQKIKPLLQLNDPVLVKKRNINTASVNELRTPYIPFNVANAIVQYRDRNGAFAAVADIMKIPLVDENLFSRISPYLSVQ